MAEHGAAVHPISEQERPVARARGEAEAEAHPARTPEAPLASGEPAGGARRRGARRWIVAGAAAAAAIGVLGWWVHARRFEDTDDAQVEANISAVSPRVQGTVKAVRVADNQEVKAGDVLVELDAADLEVALAQARANVAQAEAQVLAEDPSVPITATTNLAAARNAEADVDNARADVQAADAEVEQAAANDRFAQRQLERAKVLTVGDNIARAEYDQRVSEADVARSAAIAARKRLAGRKAKLDAALAHQREIRENAPRQLGTREATVQVRRANLEVAQARLRQAELDLSYARIVAPADGIIGKKSVNVGDRVQPGQQLMALTQTGELWVTANFRETQVRHMRAGQRARVRVDALARDYEGIIESFGGATGSRYSLLPPENATGNYVKVVQRIPVRIRLEPGRPEMERLRPGMSVEPEVKVR
jgi:membrane fusion protein (multidrug efflux system)